MKNHIIFILIVLAFVACTEDEDKIMTPSVTYPETNLNVSFFTDGSVPAPQIEWNGNQGSFSLDSNIAGLAINSTTGQVSYTKLLPPGDQNFSVIASNSAGQISIPFTINNPFSGFFEGTYSTSGYFAFDFSEDGTVAVAANSSTNPDRGTGTYIFNGDELIANYTYGNESSGYSIKVTLSQSNADARLTGSWYFAYDAPPAEEGGTVSLTFQ